MRPPLPLVCRCALAVAACLAALSPLAGEVGAPPDRPEAQSVVILANADDDASLSLARYYAAARGIPPENILALPLPTGERVSRAVFEQRILGPLRARLSQERWLNPPKGQTPRSLSYLVCCRGVPLRIDPAPRRAGQPALKPGENDGACVDAELALLPRASWPTAGAIRNPLFGILPPGDATQARVLRVSRLDGPTLADAQRLVDDALAVEATGLQGRAMVDIGGPYPAGDRWMEAVAEQIHALGFETTLDRDKRPFGPAARADAVALYFGWYAPALDGPFADPVFRFARGAIAFHLHSYSAPSLRGRHGWVAPLLAAGAAASFGNVDEPLLELTHRPDLFLRVLAEGGTLGQAGLASLPALSWQGVLVGDPLYLPFPAKAPQAGDAEGAAATPELAEAAFLRRLNLRVLQGQQEAALREARNLQEKKPTRGIALWIANAEAMAGRNAAAWELWRSVPGIADTRPRAWALSAEAIGRLQESSPAQAAAAWEALLEDRSIDPRARPALLRRALSAALASRDRVREQRWREQLAALAPPAAPTR